MKIQVNLVLKSYDGQGKLLRVVWQGSIVSSKRGAQSSDGGVFPPEGMACSEVRSICIRRRPERLCLYELACAYILPSPLERETGGIKHSACSFTRQENKSVSQICGSIFNLFCSYDKIQSQTKTSAAIAKMIDQISNACRMIQDITPS